MIEWTTFDPADGIEAMTTRDAHREMGEKLPSTFVPERCMVLGSQDGECGFALVGTPTELRLWLNRAGRALERAIAQQRNVC